MRRICIYNKKGGVGKTTLAFNLAKDLGFYCLTNDDSILEELLPNQAKILEKIQVIEENSIYDLGGFIDKNNIDIFKKSDLIIIPTLLDVNSIKRSVNTFKELNRLNSNIVFVVNQFNKKRSEKFAQSIQILQALTDIYLINESEIAINSIHSNKTIKEQIESNPLFMHSAKALYTQYTSLLKLAKGGN